MCCQLHLQTPVKPLSGSQPRKVAAAEVIRAAITLMTCARTHPLSVLSKGELVLSHGLYCSQINRVSNEGCQMWAGQVSSPVRLEREEKKDECKERARSGSASPCNFCSQLGFDGNFGFNSTTNNKPGFCARFGFSEELFIFV